MASIIPLKCKQCNYGPWIPRTAKKPKVCPRCKSYAWDQPKKVKKNEFVQPKRKATEQRT